MQKESLYVRSRTASSLAWNIKVDEASASICRNVRAGGVLIDSKLFLIKIKSLYVLNVIMSSRILQLTDVTSKLAVVHGIVLVTLVLQLMLVDG